MSEATSPKIAKLAARGLRSPGSLSLHEIQQVCGSDLTQRELLRAAAKEGPLPQVVAASIPTCSCFFCRIFGFLRRPAPA
jgi:hypothetical protein